ncbi:MAG: thioredoxin [Propionibacteriaceae bacterium]|jgi:thioredoxin|nr:thioredoxin [Propionibacteriaceae bacterium]
MGTTALTGREFDGAVKDGIVFVDFWAGWCGPCRTFSPIFESVSEANPDITWAKVDTQVEQELADALDIQSIPTLMIFREGYLVYRHPGVLDASQLQELVKQVKEVDMDKVRAAADQAEADLDA